MIEFKVIKKSSGSRARIGILKTQNGEVETPAFVPVATQAAIKTLTTRQTIETGSQILICNTFHLHLKAGEKIIKQNGGIHKFMNWPKPLMTDSGGFQVFSLGFGRDLDFSKINVNKFFPGKELPKIDVGASSKNLKITKHGVEFRSPVDGKKLFLGPRESIKIQESLGADIIFAFDECTPPSVTKEYMKVSLERTNRWAKECLTHKKSNQAIFGIIQGSVFKEFREEAARFINSLEFDGFGIGGDLGKTKKEMFEIINLVTSFLNEKKPKHLLGIGSLEDIEKIAASGIDTFDCTIPTHFARHGVVFISGQKRINLKQTKFLKDKNPIDKNCGCFVCLDHSRSYIAHLFRAKEITAMSLATFHNLYFFNKFVAEIRNKIKEGKL